MVFTFWHLAIIPGAPEVHRNKKINKYFTVKYYWKLMDVNILKGLNKLISPLKTLIEPCEL